ncbi:alpha/beta fold hydrolase [Hydrogenophaga sp. XSHU_21]
MYVPTSIARSEFVNLRGWRYHLRVWGTPEASQPPLVLVHGWMDVAASWQFVVDALRAKRHIVAPDWRGYGLTTPEGPAPDNFWFPDYLGDLDALLDHVAGERPVDLVGHSMGGNVATMYAGVRPARIRRLVNLEGFGMPATRPAQAPGRLAQWLDEIKAQRRGDMDLKPYDSAEGVARRLMKTNPRLGADKAAWLAREWARPDATGQWVILGESAHKVVNATLYRVEEALEIYQRIEAPTLSVTASDDSLSQWWKGRFTLAEYQDRIARIPRLQRAVVQDAGHMMHHDQPEALARLIEDFIDQTG